MPRTPPLGQLAEEGYTERVSMRLAPADRTALTALAAQQNISAAGVIDAALEAYICQRFAVKWPREERRPYFGVPRGGEGAAAVFVFQFTPTQRQIIRAITHNTRGAFPELVRAALRATYPELIAP